jgi:acyl-CoA synthetase (AMP-forming)/AMP-acid ligase II
MYHGSAGVMGIGAALISGATVVIKKKFSASQFWSDAIKYNCTAFSYVGELCRYLVNQPVSDLDRKHKIRVCIGNGMRANIQREFLSRFNVKCLEMYGATEGNFVLMNTVAKIGACGFVPLANRFLKVMPSYIIKIDKNNFNVIRDENGHCIECDIGETGLLVGVIGQSTRDEYNGYANSTDASNKKIINNLFKPNQNAFNSGNYF